jgi:hypothetical protein
MPSDVEKFADNLEGAFRDFAEDFNEYYENVYPAHQIRDLTKAVNRLYVRVLGKEVEKWPVPRKSHLTNES